MLYCKKIVGKGTNFKEVITSMKMNKDVCFVAVGGIIVLITRCMKKSEVLAYEDSEIEAIHHYYVKDFPTIVALNSMENNLYETDPLKYVK